MKQIRVCADILFFLVFTALTRCSFFATSCTEVEEQVSLTCKLGYKKCLFAIHFLNCTTQNCEIADLNGKQVPVCYQKTYSKNQTQCMADCCMTDGSLNMQSLNRCKKEGGGVQKMEESSFAAIISLTSSIIFGFATLFCASLCLYGAFIKGRPAEYLEELIRKCRRGGREPPAGERISYGQSHQQNNPPERTTTDESARE